MFPKGMLKEPRLLLNHWLLNELRVLTRHPFECATQLRNVFTESLYPAFAVYFKDYKRPLFPDCHFKLECEKSKV